MNDLKLKAQKEAQILINYFKAGNFAMAESRARKIIKKFPNYVVIYNILGLVLHSQKKFSEAIKYFSDAIKMNPEFFNALNNLGNAYFAIGDLKKAEIYYQRALDINPKFVLAINNLGNLRKELQNFDEAIEYYRSALKINDKLAVIHNNLGMALQSLGKFEEANKYFNLATQIDDKFTMADRNLSNSIKYSSNTAHLKKMNEKIKDKTFNNIQKIDLYFSLGKAYDDIKDYKKSFDNYKIGNKIKRDLINYKFEEDENLYKNIKNIFTKMLLKNLENSSRQKKRIIFILGMPRSGTTLVEQIISNHKKVYGGGELKDLTELVTNHFSVNEKIKFTEELNVKDKNFLNSLGEEYINNLDRFNISEIYITDKTPLNFRWLGLIKLILPESKIIHCVRNPKDNCISLFKNFFVGKLDFTYNLEEIGKYYNLYKDLMEFWKQQIPDFFYDISYEKLVKNQEIETKKLLNFCGLEWDSNCIKFENNKRAIITASVTQARKPIFKSSIDSWKKYGDELLPLYRILNN